MKKVYTGILAILYLAVSSGIAMEIHYCMGKSAGVELYGSSSEKCGNCGMTEKDTGCCHDDFKFYKLTDSHYSSTNDLHFTPDYSALITEFPLFQWQINANNDLSIADNHPPPGYSGPSACIMNGVFRL